MTRNDVAARAGVSTATVSRVYNSPGVVAPEKVERVLAAADELGYVPDKNASALRRSGTGAVVLLERRGERIHGDRLYRWFYSDMMGGMRDVLDRSMYQFGIYAYGTAREIERAPQGVLGDGVVLHGASDTRALAALKRRGHPYVCCGQVEMPRGVNAVYTDNVLGGRAAAAALLETGHARPAHVTGAMSKVEVCRLRWDGFRAGMGDRDVTLVDGELGIDGGYASAKKLVGAIKKERIDCIFVVNDLTAVGVTQALRDAGVRVPDDVSVVGYDNLPFVEVLPLRLSTIDISFGAVYARATEALLSSIRTGDPIRERIAPVYVPGETVRARSQ